MGRWFIPCLAGLALVLATGSSWAAQPKGKASDEFAALDAADAASVRQGIDKAAKAKTPKAAKALADRIRRGLAPELLLPAFDALLAIGGPNAQQGTSLLVRHRSAPIRAKATSALVKLKAKGAAETLTFLLDDEDKSVREAAAKGLSDLGPESAMPKLLAAASLGDAAAADVVAAKASHKQLPAVASRLEYPLEGPWATCLEKLLIRKDWPVKAQVSLADKLLHSGTSGATALLEKVVSGLDKQNPARQGFIDTLKASATAAAKEEKKP
ncbi:MAG: HEAT repeat domain-containing protein [Myxococcota bacterium]|jgi:hypothetical protein|nr:HEAT repeat domain-containing protein [Myxococcota bacterium]